MKSMATAAARDLKQEMKAAQAQSSEDIALETWGCRELLEIVHRSVTKMIEVEKIENMTMKAACRNGF